MAHPMRLSESLIEAATQEGAIQKRTAPKQIEFWAELGKAVEHAINLSDAIAVTQGLKKINVEPVESAEVDPGHVFNNLENSRKNRTLSKKVTSATVCYEASLNHPGLLDRVDISTGKRETGRFQNGEFRILK